MLLRIRATPNARKTEIIGWCDDDLAGRILRIRVAAPPRDGRANKEIQLFLARTLGLPKTQVRLARGTAARIKTFQIPDGAKLPS